MRATKRQWAHNLLHEATDTADIWHMAAIRKGWQVSTFPPLCSTTGALVDDPTLKAEVLKTWFFPPTHATVAISQADDPVPLPTR